MMRADIDCAWRGGREPWWTDLRYCTGNRARAQELTSKDAGAPARYNEIANTKETLVGLWSRFMSIFGAKMNRAMDRMENPAETLDYSYEKQLSLLKDVRRGLAEIATSKQR